MFSNYPLTNWPLRIVGGDGATWTKNIIKSTRLRLNHYKNVIRALQVFLFIYFIFGLDSKYYMLFALSFFYGENATLPPNLIRVDIFHMTPKVSSQVFIAPEGTSTLWGDTLLSLSRILPFQYLLISNPT